MGIQATAAARQPVTTGNDISALTRLIWFAVIWIAGISAGWVIEFSVLWTLFSSAAIYTLPPNATPAQVGAALGPFFQETTWLFPVATAVEIVGLVFLTMALRDLAKVDPPRFSLPSTLVLVLMAGAVIASAGAAPLFYSIPNVISQAPVSGTTPSAAFISAFGRLIIYIAVIALGGVLALIGGVGGMILGVWRMGTRYDETMLKIGAIMVIVPFLSILAPILMLMGASSARGRLSG
jgi:hypothetical protein